MLSSAALQAGSRVESPAVVKPREERRTIAWWPLALVVVAAVALAAGLAVVDGLPVGVVADDSMYVILARSLAAGQGFRFLNVPGLPNGTHFPPGYPALLALVSLVSPAFPGSVVVFKALNAVFLAAAAVCIALLLRRRLELGRGWALSAGAVTAVSVPLLILGSLVLSEMFFLALVLALLPALEQMADAPASTTRALLVGLAIAACALVRTHGVVLLPAIVLVLAARRRWRDAVLVSAGAVGGLLPWQLWVVRYGGGLPAPLLGMYDSYASWWLRGLRQMGPAMIGATVARTVPETTVMLSVLFSPLKGSIAHAVTLTALALLAAAGCAVAWRRMPVTLLFLAGYLGIVLVWPFQTARFVWAVWPLLLALIVIGASAAASQRAWPRALRVTLALGFVWVACGYSAYETRAVRGKWWSSLARANTARMAPLVRWIIGNTAPGDVVATEYEGAVYLYANRQAVPIVSLTPGQYLHDYTARENAVEGLLPVLEAYPVRTVVVGSGKASDAAQYLLSGTTPRLAPREQFAGGAAYTVLRP